MNLHKIANVSVIRPAILSATLVKPKKMLNIILRRLFGEASDLGLACFSDHTAIQAIQLPALKDQRNDVAVKFYNICMENNRLLRCYSGPE